MALFVLLGAFDELLGLPFWEELEPLVVLLVLVSA
jgi:hypothetical protein